MGVNAYQEMKKKTPTSKDPGVNRYARCVADAITREVDAKKQWEVTVFKDDKTVNAFALPGGKIGVYTGLLKVAKTPDQLAAVLGHEVGHVIANHSNARVSAAYATQAGLQLAQVLAGAASPQKQQLLGLLGVGAQVGILLPYGRAQESEADILGLDYMAKAGFDPRQSVTLWRNMSKAGGKQPPAFLSTHPSHKTRIRDLQARMPQALELYERARELGKRPKCK